MRGRFITIEGIEGVGKSTNVAFVADYCRARGSEVLVTREPGGTPMAERIRDLILAAPGDELSDVGELLLMFAARAEHLHALIRPALQRGVTVVCDRFTDATFAYQGGGRGVDPHKVRVLQALVQGDLVPDLTLLLDASPELSAQRIAGRGWRDRFESERHEFFARVRQAYLDIAASEPARVRIIDAAEPLAKVQAAIAQNLENFYEK
ncbi:MAG: dTMP kinase [Gammaproteobacteria bacterium]|jgi:dTMP kinase|nr:dTMP kinase [Gammaproteobacteria bacterium]